MKLNFDIAFNTMGSRIAQLEKEKALLVAQVAALAAELEDRPEIIDENDEDASDSNPE